MYKAPVEEIAFTLKHVAGLAPALEGGHLGDLSDDLVDAILSEAGRFATEAVAPLAEIGDRQGARLADGAVTMPDGWPALYKAWAEGGWNSLTASPDFGGQGLPHMLHVAALEMWNSGSMAFAIGPTLTIGAIEALTAHGSDYLKSTYLPKMVSGEWMGSMNLTEPHAGSDLGVMKTRAERRDDGTYRLFGQKIFITYGEHDFHRQHRASGARPPARCAGRHARHLALPRAEIPGRRRRFAWAPQRCLLSFDRAQARHPRLAHLHDDLRRRPFWRRAGAIGWLVERKTAASPACSP
jgi:alkylation response protein AidB-like acyl-CoA dehydrogenase